MNRREILRYTAMATGGALSTPLISSLLSGCSPGSVKVDSPLTFFSEEQFEWVTELVDLILPKTDSPSATEVGVHLTIDQMVGTVYLKEEKAFYEKEFTACLKYLQEAEFNSLEENKKLELLQRLDLSDGAELEAARSGYHQLKQQSIAYYLATEEVGTKFLNYLPVPGDYDGCIALEEVGGKAWAL